MGIDGGGSHVRVAIADADLTVVGSAEGGSANPNSAGREAAAQAIQETIRAALADAHLAPADIAAVGVGIAGTVTAREWVRETVAAAAARYGDSHRHRFRDRADWRARRAARRADPRRDGQRRLWDQRGGRVGAGRRMGLSARRRGQRLLARIARRCKRSCALPMDAPQPTRLTEVVLEALDLSRRRT